MDLNALREETVTGQAVSVAPGTIKVLDGSRLPITIVTHPAGVTTVTITGNLPAARLRPGMTVRFAGQFDERGRGVDPLDHLEVFTPDHGFKVPAVTSGRRQSIYAQVVRNTSQSLQLEVPNNEPHSLTFQLDGDAVIAVNGRTLALISGGDAVTAKGHVYVVEGRFPAKWIFASEITVATAFTGGDAGGQSK